MRFQVPEDEASLTSCDCAVINNEASQRCVPRFGISRHLPYTTHLLHSELAEQRSGAFYSNFRLHPIQFHLLFRTPSPRRCCCCSLSHVCMINGMKDFDHVANSYVSWISKTAKKNSRFIIAQRQQRNLRVSQSRILMPFRASLGHSAKIAAPAEFR